MAAVIWPSTPSPATLNNTNNTTNGNGNGSGNGVISSSLSTNGSALSSSSTSSSTSVPLSMASLTSEVERMTDIEASWVMMLVEAGSLPRIVASGNGGLNALQGAAHTHLTTTPKALYLLMIRKQFIEIESPLFIISLYNPEVTTNRDELISARDQFGKRFPRATIVDLIRARDLLEPVFLQAIKGPVGRSGRATSISNPIVIPPEIKSPRIVVTTASSATSVSSIVATVISATATPATSAALSHPGHSGPAPGRKRSLRFDITVDEKAITRAFNEVSSDSHPDTDWMVLGCDPANNDVSHIIVLATGKGGAEQLRAAFPVGRPAYGVIRARVAPRIARMKIVLITCIPPLADCLEVDRALLVNRPRVMTLLPGVHLEKNIEKLEQLTESMMEDELNRLATSDSIMLRVFYAPQEDTTRSWSYRNHQRIYIGRDADVAALKQDIAAKFAVSYDRLTIFFVPQLEQQSQQGKISYGDINYEAVEIKETEEKKRVLDFGLVNGDKLYLEENKTVTRIEPRYTNKAAAASKLAIERLSELEHSIKLARRQSREELEKAAIRRATAVTAPTSTTRLVSPSHHTTIPSSPSTVTNGGEKRGSSTYAFRDSPAVATSTTSSSVAVNGSLSSAGPSKLAPAPPSTPHPSTITPAAPTPSTSTATSTPNAANTGAATGAGTNTNAGPRLVGAESKDIRDSKDDDKRMADDDESEIVEIDPKHIVVVRQRVGQGRTAIVHKGIWGVAVVAYKELSYIRLTERIMKTFKDEVATLSRLRHKNVVALVGVCTQPTKLAIITEWVPRGALRDVLLDRTIDIKFSHVLKMAMDVAEGMAYLHSKNIIHRDLKSHNLLVDESWTVKVADFGYAKALPVDESMATTEVGTSGWVAPEVLRTMGTGYSHSVDVFSYGICIWEMISRGAPNPLCGLPAVDYFDAVHDGRRPDIPAWCPELFANLIKSCWQFDPSKRPDFNTCVSQLQAMQTSAASRRIDFDKIDVPCLYRP